MKINNYKNNSSNNDNNNISNYNNNSNNNNTISDNNNLYTLLSLLRSDLLCNSKNKINIKKKKISHSYKHDNSITR